MNGILTLFSREFKKTWLNGGTYFIIASFLTIVGINYLYILFLLTTEPNDVCSLQTYFELFSFYSLFLIPLITMRVFSEEIKLGLLESLLSTPIGPKTIVASKFLAVYFFYITLCLLGLIFPYLSQYLLRAELTTPLVMNQVLYGGLIFTLTSGVLFISIGVFASSLTRSQSVAGLLSFGLLFIMFVTFKFLCEYFTGYNSYINFGNNLSELCIGIFDIRPFVFQILTGLIILGLTTIIIWNRSTR